MKKIISGIVAVIAVICMSTGCGNKKEIKETSKTEKTTVSEKESTNEKEADKDVEVKNDFDKSVENAEYGKLIKKFIEAYINDDRKATLEMQAPEGFMDIVYTLWKTEEFEDYSEDEFLSFWQGNLYDNYNEDLKWEKASFKRIVSSEVIQDEELEDEKGYYGCMEWLVKYVNEHGNVNSDTIEEAFYNDDDYIENLKFKETKEVTFEIEVPETGEILRDKVLVSRIKGNEWKISCRFGNMFLANKKDIADDSASKFRKAGNTAIVEMMEMDKFQISDDYYILSSDESKNFNVPSNFDKSEFYRIIREYSYNPDDWKWFLVVNNNIVKYCVVVEKNSSIPVGVSFDKDEDESISGKINDDMSFDEMYDICVKAIDDK
ncbi:hypothetical protein [Ruminococcus flavefaciens]|uniref:Uncharacterized protein n=1 Tax=Ruminococcus flavefaciens TaxID=1265 RepID=A0A1M7JU41_RUMFL|nr:hypothetical protein [Ruminococcus flavefaciens]SHM56067.1 hypothetical protein SAMN04487860_106197 [Ruminococcus flavefaciens]